jgi:uncharacterized protein YprB with RNaseH-like and TPR domain
MVAMLSDEIRERLFRLHVSAPNPDSVFRNARAPEPLVLPAPLASHSWLDDGQEHENASGKYWRVRRPLATLLARLAASLSPPSSAVEGPLHPELAAVADHFPAGTLFLDLETCGFAGSPVFLAGTVWHDDEVLVLDQFFARHYGEERAVLEAFWQVAARNHVLVTFNGKSFDWPMVHDRSTRHHLGRDGRHRQRVPRRPSVPTAGLSRSDFRPELTHCDLLHHARRRWKRVLPDCRLQTLERYVCQRSRVGDLSGARVPIAYQQFVRCGVSDPVESILHHNALDLATLVQLTVRLTRPLAK